MFYVIPRVTTKRKPITDTQNKSKHNTTEHHQITKEETKEEQRNKELKNNQKKINKMVIVNPYLSIINFFKGFIEFVRILLLFYVLVFWPRGMWDLSSPTKDRTHTPCI